MTHYLRYNAHIFHVKILLFAKAKSDLNPDPHRSALVLTPWIRIRIPQKVESGIRSETNADPHHE
jgi:hypothetical protein